MNSDVTELLAQFHDICIRLFTIVGHDAEESEQNYQQLMNTTTQLTVTELIASLPEDKKSQLLQKLPQTATVEEAFPLLSNEFSPEQFQQVFTQAFTEMMDLYFTQISPSLSPKQHQKISQLLQSAME